MLPCGDLLHGNVERGGKLNLRESQCLAFGKKLFRCKKSGFIGKIRNGHRRKCIAENNFQLCNSGGIDSGYI